MREAFCIGRCGRKTKNRSRICSGCWEHREEIYQARKAREAAAAKEPNVRTEAQERALQRLNQARRLKLAKDLPATEFSGE